MITTAFLCKPQNVCFQTIHAFKLILGKYTVVSFMSSSKTIATANTSIGNSVLIPQHLN